MDYKKKKENRPIKRYKETFEEETIDFIEEGWDKELSNRLFKAIVDTILDGKPTANFRKGMVSLADAVSLYLKIGANEAHEDEEKLLTEEVGCLFFDCLDFFCFEKDHPLDEESKEEE